MANKIQLKITNVDVVVSDNILKAKNVKKAKRRALGWVWRECSLPRQTFKLSSMLYIIVFGSKFKERRVTMGASFARTVESQL